MAFLHSSELHCHIILHCTQLYGPVIHGNIPDSTSLFYIDLYCITFSFVELHKLAKLSYSALNLAKFCSTALLGKPWPPIFSTKADQPYCFRYVYYFENILQHHRVSVCLAIHCTVLQRFVHSCTAMTNCRVLYCVLQCFTVFYSVLQCFTVFQNWYAVQSNNSSYVLCFRLWHNIGTGNNTISQLALGV